MSKEKQKPLDNLSTANVIAIKLISGEEILASMLGEVEDGKDSKSVAIYEPMTIFESEAGIKLNKYMKFSDSKIVVLKIDKIISIGTVPNTVSNVYKMAVKFYNDIIVTEIDNELIKVNKILKESLAPIANEVIVKVPSPDSILVPGSKCKN